MSDLTPMELFWSLASGRFSQSDGFDEAKNRCKFLFRSALTLPSTLHWLGTFSRSPQLLEYLRHNPRLACKLHRPYLYRSLPSKGKVAALQAHYQIISRCFSEASRSVLLSQQKLKLASVSGKDDTRFDFYLTHQHSFDKEGELSLQIVDGQEITLATLTFTLTERAGKIFVIIGGLQGPRKRYGHECIRTATKACHGLFPKRLVIEALIALTRKIGGEGIAAVCKDKHIYSSWRYKRDFQADYDAFWESIGAEMQDQCFFQLPYPIPRKAMEEIASKKRAEYQRRYALLDSIATQIAEVL